MTFSALIFDFDGTLFDTRKAIVATMRATFVERNQAPPQESRISGLVGKGITLEKTFDQLVPTSENGNIADWVIHYRRLYNNGIGIANSSPFPGVIDLLRALSASAAPSIVVSNKGEVAVENTLAHYGIRAAIDMIVAANGAAATKPDPASYFDRVLPVIGHVSGKDVLVIGDTDADIRYARAIDALSCWVSFGYGDPTICQSLKPTYTAASVSELSSVLGMSMVNETLGRTTHGLFNA